MSRHFSLFVRNALAAAIVACFSMCAYGQKPASVEKSVGGPAPTITKIDEVELKKLLIPRGKPLLVNFWATWCDPCREEFPELVKMYADYKGRIDFLTISLDDLADINTEVPKFLIDMKSSMPAYLLKTDDEDAAMRSVSANWAGGLPFTILFDPDGSTAYFRQGKIRPDILRIELAKRTSMAVK